LEVVRLADSAGTVMHAELLINDSRIMLADEFPDMGYRSPQSYWRLRTNSMAIVAAR
jgi:PhnB protein